VIFLEAEGGVVSKLSSLEELFAGRHFDREVIILCVRWYLRYKLSFRDLQAIRPRVRQAMEPLWPDCRPLVESR
jgi:hypothetical protein